MKHKVIAATTIALNSAALFGGGAYAQPGSISAQPVPQSVGHSYAGSTFGSPMAFGADWGSIGIGIYGQTLPSKFNGVKDVDKDEDVDGSAALVFGVGDADDYVGLETAVITSSLTGSKVQGDDKFGDSGGLSFKLHTNLPGGAALAVGVIGTSRWGNAQDANESSVYAVGTKVFAIDTGSSRHALVVNVGAGDGGFTKDFDDDGLNAFGSVAFFFTRQISVIADWNGRFLNAAVSAAPFEGIPIVLTLGAVNTTERFNSNTQFGGTLGYTFSF